MNLPCIDSTVQPFDLGKLALAGPPAQWSNTASPTYYAPAAALYTAMTTVTHQTPLPLPLSNSTGGGAYSARDGYWLPNGYPIIKGVIKIEEQTAYGSPCGTWKDVTIEILSYGYAGRNINPVPQSFDNATVNPQWVVNPLNGDMSYGASPGLPRLPSTQYAYQNASGTYAAGTFTGASTSASNPQLACLDPHPWAVIRLERIRDNPSTVPFTAGALAANNKPVTSPVANVCGVDPTTKLPMAGLVASDFWPNVLFDTREGTLRDVTMSASNLPTLNGLMHYVEVDGGNLASWFSGVINKIPTTGGATKDGVIAPNDFLFYVSDRRGNYAKPQTLNAGWPPLSYTKNETGEYGWTDVVNSSNPATGCPNNVLDNGEDIDNTTGTSYGLFYYGAQASYIHAANTALASLLPGQLGILPNLNTTGLAASSCPIPTYSTVDNIWPMMLAANSEAARENPPLFFRRAIKIVNASNLSAVGACPNGVNCGLAFATENPVYVQGDFNANFGGSQFNGTTEVATSIAGDAVTLLSDNWNDINSFVSPYSTTYRQGSTTWYQTAIVAGKPLHFLQPTGTGNDYGTDGGVHNFLRYIEAWSGTLEYRGSIVALYTSRQANSTFKCCNTVYSPPDRGYNFDTNFLNPTLLPPRTPLFRSINTTGWTRVLTPGVYQQ